MMEAEELQDESSSDSDSVVAPLDDSDDDGASSSSDDELSNGAPAAAGGAVLPSRLAVHVDSDEQEFELLPGPPTSARSSSDSDLPVGVGSDIAVSAPTSGRKRRRLRRGDDKSDVIKPEMPVAPSVIIKPQPTECTVCYDPCTNAGRHRLVSLKCGHVFGKKCIDRWVLERKTCPNCSVAVRKADIRPLFTDHVAVVDNTGVEDMAQKYEAETSKRIQVETELSRVKLQLQLAQADAKKFQDEAAQWRKQAADLQCRAASEQFTATPSQAAATQGYVVGASQSLGSQLTQVPTSQYCQSGGFLMEPTPSTPTRPHPLPGQPRTPSTPSSETIPGTTYRQLFQLRLQSSRVCAISTSCSFMCVGETLSPSTFGVVKLSTADALHAVRIPAHSSPVRDVSISPRDDLVVSVAWDGKLVISNLRSYSVVMRYTLPQNKRNAWSCRFSQVDPFRVYCGFHDGTIAQYDIRRPTTASDVVALFELPIRQPVHSIQLNPVMGNEHEQLVAATFAGFGIWSSDQLHRPLPNGAATRPATFQPSPNCCAVSSSQIKRGKLVVTTRTQSPTAPAKHNIFELSVLGASTEPSLRSSLEGFRTPPAISRAAIWEARNGDTMVASWDDERKQVNLWDESTKQVTSRLVIPPSDGGTTPPIVDVQHSIAGGDWRRSRALLGLLSPGKLVVYAGTD